MVRSARHHKSRSLRKVQHSITSTCTACAVALCLGIADVEKYFSPCTQLVFKANQPVALGGEKRDIVDAAFNDLRDLEDVEDVWHNLLPDEDESEEA